MKEQIVPGKIFKNRIKLLLDSYYAENPTPRLKFNENSWIFDSEDFNQALLIMCMDGRLLEVKFLVKWTGADVNYHNGLYLTPLHSASYYGHSDVMRYLLNQNAAINLAHKHTGITPLHCAISKVGHERKLTERSKEAIMVLIDSGANIHYQPAKEERSTPYLEAKRISPAFAIWLREIYDQKQTQLSDQSANDSNHTNPADAALAAPSRTFVARYRTAPKSPQFIIDELRSSRRKFPQIKCLLPTDSARQKTAKVVAIIEADKVGFASLLDESGKIKESIQHLIQTQEKAMSQRKDCLKINSNFDTQTVTAVDIARRMLHPKDAIDPYAQVRKLRSHAKLR